MKLIMYPSDICMCVRALVCAYNIHTHKQYTQVASGYVEGR